MNKQERLDKRYLRMARIWAENSYAVRRQVGCLIVKDKAIISDGYNGTPSGFENICENVECSSQWIHGCVKTATSIEEVKSVEHCKDCTRSKLVTKPYVLHAEANAISKLARSSNNSDGATLYVTDEPCLECSKMIIQAGIRRVVFWRDYHTHAGTELLNRAGIEVIQIKNIDQ
jgi:dCMP deaminase